jgi:hypothetical protein
LKARPTSATSDLSYVKSNPMLDRALRRVEVVHDLPSHAEKQKRVGEWADPACIQGVFPALQGEPDRWNSALLARQVKRTQNVHKLPNRRSKGAPIRWVLLGVARGLDVLTTEQPHPFWDDLRERMSATPIGEQSELLEHVTAYIHTKCQFQTKYSRFTVSSHMALNRLKRKGRCHASSHCMVNRQDLVPISSGHQVHGAEQDGDLVPVSVMYFARLVWHSGVKVGEGISAFQKYAYALLLPAVKTTVHGHSVLRYQVSDVKLANTVHHFLVPLESIAQPLIVDRNNAATITLIPFKGKGLQQVGDDDEVEIADAQQIDWENVGDDVI